VRLTDYGALVEAFPETRGRFPTRTTTTPFECLHRPPGDCVSLSKRDSTPLIDGALLHRGYSPIPAPGRSRWRHPRGCESGLMRAGLPLQRATSFVLVPILCDRRAYLMERESTNSIIHVSLSNIIADVRAVGSRGAISTKALSMLPTWKRTGVRLNHPPCRTGVAAWSSPSGTRCLPGRNRAGRMARTFGFGTPQLKTVIPISTFGGRRKPNIFLNLKQLPNGTSK